MVGPRCLRYRKQSAFLTMTACGVAVLCLYVSLASLAPLVPPASTLSLPTRHPADAGGGGGGGLPTSVYHHRALQNSRAVEILDGGKGREKNSPVYFTHPHDANRGGAAAKPEGVRLGERGTETGGKREGVKTEGKASSALHLKSDLTGVGLSANKIDSIVRDTEAFNSVPGGENSFHQVPDRTVVGFHRVPSRPFHNDHSATHDQTRPVPGVKDDNLSASAKLTDSVPRDHSAKTAEQSNDNEDAHGDHVRPGDVSTVPTPHRAAPGTGSVVGREGERTKAADRWINSRTGGGPTTNSTLASDTAIYVDEEGEGWREGEGEEYPMEGPHAPRPLGAVRRLPQALIIGVKKAGTRALLEFLRIHPDVRAPGPEPHFFDKHYHLGLEWYRKQMPPSLEGQLTIEKTPSYYVTREVPKRIYNMSKDVKLIVVVRDPVVRAISDYTQGASKRPDIPPFEQMAFVDNSTRLVDTKWGAVRIGVYAKHLERWLRYFPLDHIHFVSGERLISDPAEEVGKVQDFLGLPRLVTAKHFYLNETRGFPCIIKPGGSGRPHCLGKTKGRTHPDVPPDVLKRLRDFFRPFNLKFYQMTGQDFGWT